MKKLIYILGVLLMGGLYQSCKEQEIELYDQEARINFYSYRTAIEFVDSDYVKKTPFLVDSFQVRIQGTHLSEAKTFCVKTVENTDYDNPVEISLEKTYTYTNLTDVVQKFPYKIIRPELKADKKVYGCFLEFDLLNPNHKFAKGLIEKHRLVVHVSWNLRPSDWEEWPWGDYSDAKYIFMMDVLGRTYKEITEDDFDTVEATYAKHKESGNPPIVDDKGNEIQF